MGVSPSRMGKQRRPPPLYRSDSAKAAAKSPSCLALVDEFPCSAGRSPAAIVVVPSGRTSPVAAESPAACPLVTASATCAGLSPASVTAGEVTVAYSSAAAIAALSPPAFAAAVCAYPASGADSSTACSLFAASSESPAACFAPTAHSCGSHAACSAPATAADNLVILPSDSANAAASPTVLRTSLAAAAASSPIIACCVHTAAGSSLSPDCGKPAATSFDADCCCTATASSSGADAAPSVGAKTAGVHTAETATLCIPKNVRATRKNVFYAATTGAVAAESIQKPSAASACDTSTKKLFSRSFARRKVLAVMSRACFCYSRPCEAVRRGPSLSQSSTQRSSCSSSKSASNRERRGMKLFFGWIQHSSSSRRRRIRNNTSARFRRKYKVGKILGHGAFGKVRECIDRETKEVYAVKIMPLRTRQKHPWCSALMFKREIALLCSLSHPHIVRLHGAYEDCYNVYYVMEKCNGGELFERIVRCGHFEEHEASRLCRQMLLALDYLHNLSIVHRDIKAENFLFRSNSSTASLVLIDFGMSVRLKPGQMLSEVCGSPHYLSPELLRRQYACPADMWALGVLLYLMLYGHYPYDDRSTGRIVRHILYKPVEYRSSHIQLSPLALNFLRSLLEADPKKRLTTSQALQHRWILEGASNMHPQKDAMPETVLAFPSPEFPHRTTAGKRLAACVRDEQLRAACKRREMLLTRRQLLRHAAVTGHTLCSRGRLFLPAAVAASPFQGISRHADIQRKRRMRLLHEQQHADHSSRARQRVDWRRDGYDSISSSKDGLAAPNATALNGRKKSLYQRHSLRSMYQIRDTRRSTPVTESSTPPMQHSYYGTTEKIVKNDAAAALQQKMSQLVAGDVSTFGFSRDSEKKVDGERKKEKANLQVHGVPPSQLAATSPCVSEANDFSKAAARPCGTAGVTGASLPAAGVQQFTGLIQNCSTAKTASSSAPNVFALRANAIFLKKLEKPYHTPRRAASWC